MSSDTITSSTDGWERADVTWPLKDPLPRWALKKPELKGVVVISWWQGKLWNVGIKDLVRFRHLLRGKG